MTETKQKNVLIMGAAGMDFHLFNVYFREDPEYRVKCFTATQIPFIDERHYPPELSGELYPLGIPIYPETVKEGGRVVEKVPEYITKFDIHIVIIAYSDLAHQEVMHKASMVNAAGATFWIMSNEKLQIKSTKPVISICATRTGCGKSQTTRFIAKRLREKGHRVVAIRHPMPYDPDLTTQICQRYEDYSDLDKYNTTIEEREEYEPHIDMGVVLYAGVDYGKIIREAEKEADIILWDGGNNDIPFYRPDLGIVVADPLRAGHETAYHPGEINLRSADVIVINKMDTASMDDIMTLRENIMRYNPGAVVVDAASPVIIEEPGKIKGKRALVVEDGPTLTHGGMKIGAGYVAALKYGVSEMVSPVNYAVGTIADTFRKFPHLEKVLPAMGYSELQRKELQDTINSMARKVDVVIAGTPIDLTRIITSEIPIVRVRYSLSEIGKPGLGELIDEFEGRL